jgi:hydroxylamine reductase
MFCYQCEQTGRGTGCTKVGVCGKQPEVAALQDLLVYAAKGLALVGVEGRRVGVTDRDVDISGYC